MMDKYRKTLNELDLKVKINFYLMKFEFLDPDDEKKNATKSKLDKLEFKHNYEYCIEMLNDYSSFHRLDDMFKKYSLSIEGDYADANYNHTSKCDFFNKSYAIAYRNLVNSFKYINFSDWENFSKKLVNPNIEEFIPLNMNSNYLTN